jgi:S1-C subfamily serine protease
MAQKRAILATAPAKVHDLGRKRLNIQGNFVYYAPPMQRLWLIFAQAATVAVAVLFVISTFRPEWLPSRTASQLSVVQQAPTTGPQPSALSVGSYNEAVTRAAPSVVNIFTSKEIRSPRHPLLNDPIFRRFFGEQMPETIWITSTSSASEPKKYQKLKFLGA